MQRAQRVVVAAAVVAIWGLGERAAEAGFCPGWGCNGNSATVGDGIVFDELNVFGVLTEAGIRIRSVKLPDGGPGQLLVKGDHLSVLPKGSPRARPLTGAGLIGTIITIAHTDGRAYELKIVEAVDGCQSAVLKTADGKAADGKVADLKKAVLRKADAKAAEAKAAEAMAADPNCLRFWSTPEDPVPYYTFLVKKISKRFAPKAALPAACNDDRELDRGYDTPICLGTNLDREWKEGVKKSALAFEGDHFDPNTKEVSRGQKGWFNLSCAGTAAAKMHLLRHTEAGSIKSRPPLRKTTFPQRTAMLRMLTADYCSNGSAFTVNGQPLLYGDVRKWYPSSPFTSPTDPRVRSFEGAWGPKGLLCLNEPRKFCMSVVKTVCSTELDNPGWTPPPCPTDGTVPAGTYVISANPKPDPPTTSVPPCITNFP
jgi:hypothetical protein